MNAKHRHGDDMDYPQLFASARNGGSRRALPRIHTPPFVGREEVVVYHGGKSIAGVWLACALLLGCDSDSGSQRPAAEGDGGSEGGSEKLRCESTWEAIQTTIFDGHGCTSGPCHDGSDPAGSLDLRPDRAYASLVQREATIASHDTVYRVRPGEEKVSLLYRKLEAATRDLELMHDEGAPMPAGNREPISDDELAALRLWIRAGAPETGVVGGTQSLLGCELPAEADPNKSPPPPVPDVEDGFQHMSGPWSLEPNSEGEVCFFTYYDLSESSPEWARVPCTIGEREQTCVAVKRAELSQDAQSHHSVITVYGGSGAPDDPSFGSWRCAGGELDGTACSPSKIGTSARDGGADCGENSVCQTVPLDRVGCSALGPDDVDTHSRTVGGAQTPFSTTHFPEGVFVNIPIRGVVGWNSHAFNLTEKATTIEQFNTFWYARPEEREYPMQGVEGGRHIFDMNVAPYTQQEICAVTTLPQHARLNDISSHVHKRGVLWRTWLPPNDPECLPDSTDPECGPNERPPDYTSQAYDDPVVRVFEPPRVLDDPDPWERTIKFCAVFDNGKEYPELLKRASEIPDGANGCSRRQLACAGGENKGTLCAGDDAECGERGVCDACPVLGGVTTEDEMFIFIGNYYVVPPDETDGREEETP